MQAHQAASSQTTKASKASARTIAFGLACALACALPPAASASSPSQACRASRLAGLYVFAANGYNIVAGVPQPKAIVEVIDFNGDGTLTTPGLTLSINGNIVRVPQGNPGSYTLEEDCRGSITFQDRPSFDFTPDLVGGTLWMIQINLNTVFQGTARGLRR